jgi:hypothetical protein
MSIEGADIIWREGLYVVASCPHKYSPEMEYYNHDDIE